MIFKVGDKVKVVRRSIEGKEIYWNPLMDKAIGKVYTVLEITGRGNLRLSTELDTQYDYLYPPKGVEKVIPKKRTIII